MHFVKLKIKILKKLLFTLLGASLIISCSSDDAKMKKDELTYDHNSFVLKDNISKVNLDVQTNFVPSHENARLIKSNQRNVFLENKFIDSFGEIRTALVEYDGIDLFTISFKETSLVYYIKKIAENEFFILNENNVKLQKIAMLYDASNNLNIKTIEIYNHKNQSNNNNLISTRGGWYSCMEERMSDPLNQVLLAGAAAAAVPSGGSSFLGYMAGVAGIGVYCAF